MSVSDFEQVAPFKWRPKVKIDCYFRAQSCAPESVSVEIDVDGVSSVDVVTIINAMAYLAYGPVPAAPNGVSGYGAERQLSPTR